MLGGSCHPCCQQTPFFVAGLTLSGWSGWLNAYNGGTSFTELLDRTADPYADNVPKTLASVLTNLHSITPSGAAACTLVSTFPDSVGPRCYGPVLTFSSSQVTLQLTLRINTIGISIGGGPSFTHFVTTTNYTKDRSGFWESKYDDGIYYFYPQDATSFTTTQPIVDINNVGTVAIVQRSDPRLGLGAIFPNYLQFPMRFDLVTGVPEFLGARDFATSQANTGAFTFVPVLNADSLGYRYLVVDNTLGVTRAGWGISRAYWEAFSSNGSMTIENVGTDHGYLPGAGAANGVSYVPSTLIVTQL